MFNQTNIGNVSRATWGRLLRDEVERVWAFPSPTIPSWAELKLKPRHWEAWGIDQCITKLITGRKGEWKQSKLHRCCSITGGSKRCVLTQTEEWKQSKLHRCSSITGGSKRCVLTQTEEWKQSKLHRCSSITGGSKRCVLTQTEEWKQSKLHRCSSITGGSKRCVLTQTEEWKQSKLHRCSSITGGSKRCVLTQTNTSTVCRATLLRRVRWRRMYTDNS